MLRLTSTRLLLLVDGNVRGDSSKSSGVKRPLSRAWVCHEWGLNVVPIICIGHFIVYVCPTQLVLKDRLYTESGVQVLRISVKPVFRSNWYQIITMDSDNNSISSVDTNIQKIGQTELSATTGNSGHSINSFTIVPNTTHTVPSIHPSIHHGKHFRYCWIR